MKNNTVRLSVLLAAFVALWVVTSVVRSTAVWFMVMNGVAIYIICKYKSMDKKDMVLGLIFGIICMPSNFVMGLSVILPYIASVSVLRTSQNKIPVFDTGKKSGVLWTFVLIAIVGGLLGGINIMFALSSMKIQPSFQIQWLMDALRAGVFEEIFFRFFFFAICVEVTKDKSLSPMQNTLRYLVMVIPHVLIHFNLQTINLGSVIMLTLLFGLPFAVMQRKVNLISAIGAHAVVDLLRFCVFGA